MRQIQVDMGSLMGETDRVGTLDVFSQRGSETYAFEYDPQWLKSGFQIDPLLPLVRGQQHSATLPGAFQDVSPDRWGRMVQDRASGGRLTDAEYMLGVSDLMRQGALRLSDAARPGEYLNANKTVPKLVDVRELEAASLKLERGQETAADLLHLIGPGSSLGGAHPKAAVLDKDGSLMIAKFQSSNDTERVASWESTMLELARLSGMNVADSRLLSKDQQRPILLARRFDREGDIRMPFASAMTFAGLSDGRTHRDAFSYADLVGLTAKVSVQPKADCFELWRRMTFNAVAGNTDDHLRNHGFIRYAEGWRLSPAYDLNPNNMQIAKRSHALAFMPGDTRPSLDLCIEIAGFFNVDKSLVDQGLAKLADALSQWESVAQKNGLSREERGRMSSSFEHSESEQLKSQHLKIASSKKRSIKRS